MAPEAIRDELAALDAAVDQIAGADRERLTQLHTELLGRKAGRLTRILRALPALPDDQRRVIGSAANTLRRRLEAAFAEREAALAAAGAAAAAVDRTMPGRRPWRGAVHPVTAAADHICDIFRELGFVRVTGTEAESPEYNFTRLNIALDHPAADEHDTLWLADGGLLRTHTSPTQAHTMERYPPPIRIVAPGLVYRRDPFDASHAPAFEQIEGLVVDEGVSFVDLKAAISYFAERFFAAGTPVRFRPSFFPFTEPSAEVDVRCTVCGGGGCSTCKGTGWMEIMGAGMVDPAVFTACGIDPERYTGYAWGMGVERIAMLRHDIPDIRLFYEGDVRFLEQFAGGRA
jgi:phenylalanyl-tRNA synthetase alpha chain